MLCLLFRSHLGEFSCHESPFNHILFSLYECFNHTLFLHNKRVNFSGELVYVKERPIVVIDKNDGVNYGFLVFFPFLTNLEHIHFLLFSFFIEVLLSVRKIFLYIFQIVSTVLLKASKKAEILIIIVFAEMCDGIALEVSN